MRTPESAAKAKIMTAIKNLNYDQKVDVLAEVFKSLGWNYFYALLKGNA